MYMEPLVHIFLCEDPLIFSRGEGGGPTDNCVVSQANFNFVILPLKFNKFDFLRSMSGPRPPVHDYCFNICFQDEMLKKFLSKTVWKKDFSIE